MNKLSFSGHESFTCKQFWLKKGFDFAQSQKKFADETAVIELGVGKNMVSSVRFWLKAFDLLNENETPNDMAEYLFGTRGKDPFIEHLGTIWLLHYNLIKAGKASLYSLVFNDFRKLRIDFTKEQLHSFLKHECLQKQPHVYNNNTINTDINVFIKNYLTSFENKADIEDDFSGLLFDLKLLRHYKMLSPDDDQKKPTDWYKIEGAKRSDLPYQIVLFTILDNAAYSNSNSISFNELMSARNSPGLIFALNEEGMYDQIEQITGNYTKITYTETAGNRVLQFVSKPDKWAILNEYYNI